MSYLLKILPSTLKTQLAKFLYQDAILVNRFLQDRDDNFYSKYLEELKSERFVKGDVISKIGNRVENIYFIMNGVVLNKTTNRYLEAGQMLNYEYILQKTFITQNLVAETDVSALKYDRETFQNILDQFPDTLEEMQQILKDKAEQQVNEQFVKDSINNDMTRQVIVDHYENIIKEEKDKFTKTHESIALRLLSNDIEENLGIKRGKGEIKVSVKRRTQNAAPEDEHNHNADGAVENPGLEIGKSIEEAQIN
jgi:CRP-like cAMP-binding protein